MHTPFNKDTKVQLCIQTTVKPALSGHSKRPKIDFQDLLSLNAGQKYCRMLQGEHSAIILTFIKLPFALKTFVLSILDWPLKTGFTVWSVFGHKMGEAQACRWT